MKTLLQLLVATLALANVAAAQLGPGSIMFVALNCDGNPTGTIQNKGLAFVALENIPAGTVIFFRDDEWNGSAFIDANEGTLQWTAPAGGISPGTVITLRYSGTMVSSILATGGGVAASADATFDPSSATEAVYAYATTNNVFSGPIQSFLTYATNNLGGSGASLTNTGLTVGSTALSIPGDEDVMIYTGTVTCNFNGPSADCGTTLANPANWTTQDAANDQSLDGIFPDFTVDVPATFTISFPVEFLGLSAIQNTDGINLNWATASENNNAYFTAERSTATGQWEAFGQVEGAGRSTTQRNYTYTDNTPVFTNGFARYRIRQTDFDGAFSFSNTVEVRESGIAELSLYPNPAQDLLTVNTSSRSETSLSLFDTQGRVVLNTLVANGQPVDVSELPAGIYAYRIDAGTEQRTGRLVIQ